MVLIVRAGKNQFTIVGGFNADPKDPNAPYRDAQWNGEGSMDVLKDYYKVTPFPPFPLVGYLYTFSISTSPPLLTLPLPGLAPQHSSHDRSLPLHAAVPQRSGRAPFSLHIPLTSHAARRRSTHARRRVRSRRQPVHRRRVLFFSSTQANLPVRRDREAFRSRSRGSAGPVRGDEEAACQSLAEPRP